MCLPVTLGSPPHESEVPAITKDVSVAGIYIHAESGDLTVGAQSEFVLLLPGEVTLGESIRVHCKGRVVRVDARESGGGGVALQIESYQFLGMA